MTHDERLNLLSQLAACGYTKRLPNGEDRYIPPPVNFSGNYYSFYKGEGNFNHWLVDKHGRPTTTDELNQIALDLKITRLAVKQGIIKEKTND